MIINAFWERFYSSGKLSDYIDYCQSNTKGFENIEFKGKGPSIERDHNQRKR